MSGFILRSTDANYLNELQDKLRAVDTLIESARRADSPEEIEHFKAAIITGLDNAYHSAVMAPSPEDLARHDMANAEQARRARVWLKRNKIG